MVKRKWNIQQRTLGRNGEDPRRKVKKKIGYFESWKRGSFKKQGLDMCVKHCWELKMRKVHGSGNLKLTSVLDKTGETAEWMGIFWMYCMKRNEKWGEAGMWCWGKEFNFGDSILSLYADRNDLVEVRRMMTWKKISGRQEGMGSKQSEPTGLWRKRPFLHCNRGKRVRWSKNKNRHLEVRR